VEGAEIWSQIMVDQAQNTLDHKSLDPHYSGQGRVRVGIEHITTYAARPQDATVTGWADPVDSEDPLTGLYPFNFHLPDYDAVRDLLAEGHTMVFQISAFAERLKCFQNIEEYDNLVAPIAYHPNGKPAFVAPESFFPSSTAHDENGVEVPDMRASFTGAILSVEAKINPYTSGRFYHLLVRSHGGTFDVVAPPEMVQGGIPVADGITQGRFWLSGRLSNDQDTGNSGMRRESANTKSNLDHQAVTFYSRKE
jgi:hypothetical protein